MVFDRNPQFGKDQSFAEAAVRATDFLWDNTKGDLSSFPKSYLENLKYEFSDGDVSMLELMDRVDLGDDATYEDYCEVRDSLLKVDPARWPNPESVVEIYADDLKYQIQPDFDFSEFDFADEIVEEEVVTEKTVPSSKDNLSAKMELFFKKVISSVYLDGVTAVTDQEGNPPNQANNYLMDSDGKSFSGVFYDSAPNEQPKSFPFSITENNNGKWGIKY
jgi:hypothetical protein